MNRILAVTTAALLGSAVALPAAAEVELNLARFFGVCANPTTDVAAANGEDCIIQAIIGSFSEADNGITVTELPADWENYYNQLKTWMVGGNAPDVFVMHKHRLLEFAGIGALAEITAEDYAEAGIDVADFTDRAVEGVTLNDKQYGVPLDFHAYLWHINLDLLDQAGLVDADGKPVLPTGPEEMLENARLVKEATGKDYMTGFFAGQAASVRKFVAHMAQHGVDPYDAEGVNLQSDAAAESLTAYRALHDEGVANLKLPDDAIRNRFFMGEAAVLIDGTWRVDANDATIARGEVVLKDYYVSQPATLFEQGGAWADTHMWAIPASLKRDDPEKFKAAMQLLAHINDYNFDWARTGHLPVRRSVLESDDFNNLPHRDEYAETAEIAYYMQPASRYGAIQEAMGRNLVEYFQNDKPLDATLADMQFEVEDLID